MTFCAVDNLKMERRDLSSFLWISSSFICDSLRASDRLPVLMLFRESWASFAAWMILFELSAQTSELRSRASCSPAEAAYRGHGHEPYAFEHRGIALVGSVLLAMEEIVGIEIEE
jgi:hypothetical protein